MSDTNLKEEVIEKSTSTKVDAEGVASQLFEMRMQAKLPPQKKDFIDTVTKVIQKYS